MYGSIGPVCWAAEGADTLYSLPNASLKPVAGSQLRAVSRLVPPLVRLALARSVLWKSRETTTCGSGAGGLVVSMVKLDPVAGSEMRSHTGEQILIITEAKGMSGLRRNSTSSGPE